MIHRLFIYSDEERYHYIRYSKEERQNIGSTTWWHMRYLPIAAKRTVLHRLVTNSDEEGFIFISTQGEGRGGGGVYKILRIKKNLIGLALNLKCEKKYLVDTHVWKKVVHRVLTNGDEEGEH